MIVDASAVLAILFGEEDAARYASALESAEISRMSTANWLEAAIRIDMTGQPVAQDAFEDLIAEAGIEIAPIDEAQARLARRAYRTYGRGSGHAAKLNFGDCFAYALTKQTGEPLLFKGEDFSHTDIEAA